MNAPVSLNTAQMQAVHHLHGPCLVLAGAGLWWWFGQRAPLAGRISA